jgi:Vam6/Vps39-like protein vacuolar protein sorting-associated protein 39
LFQSGNFDAAIDTFIELDINPAKVVALYPESVAGRLSIPPDGWIPLYGGPARLVSSADDTLSSNSSKEDNQDRPASEHLDTLVASQSGMIRDRLKGLGAFMPSGYHKDDDTVSISSKKKSDLHSERPSYSSPK